MRLAFLGSADFSVPSLRAVVDAGHQVELVVTQPDKPGDRGRPAPRPVAEAAGVLGLALWQPARLRDDEAVGRLLDLGLDALVVAAYGQILPAALLEGPRFGGVNVHASLLPRWRGASPVAAAILNGDGETGVCIISMDAGVDTGPVYARRAVPIPPDATTPWLTMELAGLGAGLLVEVLGDLEAGTARAEPQDEAGATYAPRLRREDAWTSWAEHTAVGVDRRVRALNPWPGVIAPLGGVEVRLLAGGLGQDSSGRIDPGEVVRSDHRAVEVATREGAYRIDTLQPPGRRPMDAAAFLRGRRR
jgi:methionyl-tRNA formyltransferase